MFKKVLFFIFIFVFSMALVSCSDSSTEDGQCNISEIKQGACD